MDSAVKLWDHQQKSVTAFERDGHRGLFYEMGCGKTLAAIRCAMSLPLKSRRVPWVLVVCPSSVVEQWAREIAKHAPELAPYVQKLEGEGKRRRQKLLEKGKRIFILNIEAVAAIPQLWAAIAQAPLELLIIDESHHFKNPKAKRVRAMIPVADKTPHKLLLSGSPMLNDYLDYWPQLRILKRGIVDDNFYAFRNRYFYDVNATKKFLNFADWRPKPGVENYLADLLARYTDRVELRECRDMPPLIRETVYTTLSPDLRRMYREMERDFLTWVDATTVLTADIVLTKLLRLQQIACGIVPQSESTYSDIPVDDAVAASACDLRLFESGKLQSLKEFLEELCPHNKVVVWSNFRTPIPAIERLCDTLGLYHVTVQGGQRPDVRQQALDNFTGNPKYSVCIANQAAGGTGIDGLQVAAYMIYFSKSYNLGHDLQSQARIERAGAECHEKLVRIDIVAKDTIEEKITTALAKKLELAEFVFELRRMKEAA